MKKIALVLFVLQTLCLLHFRSNAQLNKSNGYSTQNVPLFNWKDDKAGLELDISLHYSSGGGVLSNEQASAIGLKWGLNIGGVIEREARGVPDDQYCTYTPNINPEYLIVRRDFEEDYNNYYPNGYLYTNVSPANMPKELAIQPRFRESQTEDYKQSIRSSADREADIFRFTINGRTGSFIIGKNKIPVSLDYSEVKISFTERDLFTEQKIRTKINSFTIIDENGLIYRFSEFGRTKVSKAASTSFEITPTANVNHNSNTPINEYIINEWHLSSITNPLTNVAITFEYSEVYSENSTLLDPNTQVSVSSSADAANRIEYTSMSCTHSKSYQYKRQLQKIILPDNRLIQFHYLNNILREDVPAESPVNRIEFSYMNKTVQFAEFSYKYFYRKQLIPLDGVSVSPDEKRFLRLALVGVKSGGANNSTLPETGFEYYTGADEPDEKAIVPPRFTFATDDWGYYNASSQITETGKVEDFSYYNANKWQLANFMIAKMEKENPYVLSDGSSPMYPEQLKIKDIKPGFAKYGLLRKVKFNYGGSLEYFYEQNKSLNDIVGGVRVNKIRLEDGEGNQTVTNYKYGYRECVDCSEPSESGWGYELPKFSMLMTSTHNATADGVIESFKKNGRENIDINSYEKDKFLKTAVQANSLLQTGAQFMGYHSFGNFLQSTLESNKWSFKLDYNGIINFILQTLLYNISSKKSIACSYTPLNYRNSFGINYSSVTEWLNNGEAGYKTEILTGKQDMTFPAWQTTPYNFPYSNRQRFYSWEVGLPKTTEYYDSNWKLKKREDYKYSFKVKTLDNNYQSVTWGVAGYYSHRHDWYAYNTAHVPDNMLVPDSYTYKIGKSFLAETKTTIFGEDNNISTQVTKYEYNQQNHQISSAYSADSKGLFSGVNTYYVTDYNIPGVLQTMKDKNLINTPVAVVSWIQKDGEPKKMVSTNITEFRQLSNGDIKPVVTYGNRVQNLPVVNMVNNFNPANLANYPDLEITKTNFYDAGGSLVQIEEPDRNPESFINNYNSRFVVANIENAESGKTAYTSFETLEATNWLINRCPTTTAYSLTGDWSLRLMPSGSVTTSVATNEPYILSFWIKGSSINVTAGALLVPKVQTQEINGWRYLQYEIPATSPPPVITGNGYLDELRLYPKKASMVTTTYNPASGKKTSDCDINNKITYYLYDNLGRLVAERDAHSNIIKYYEYNYKNQ